MKHLFRYFIISCLCFATNTGFAQSKIRIACIGNSITFGSGLKDRAKESYPAQLQALLGPAYEVLNFGVSGATMLKKGNKPYWKTPEYEQALVAAANVYFVKLGTNDSKLINRPMMGDYVNDYRDMVRTLAKLQSRPRIILLTPIKAFSDEKFGISGTYLKDSIIPSIQKLAYEENLEVIDLHSLFADKEALLADKIHPNAEGDGFIAKRLYELIAQQTKKTGATGSIPKLNLPAEKSSFYGYNCFQFKFKERNAKIAVPKREAAGKPWIWRARFWGHEPQTDIALLERGYHVVYCDVAELFGNSEAINLWNGFYNHLQKLGFAKKAVLEGMSRGGVYVYNWAAANPKKVTCIYADNPVLDLKSWPGGKGIGPGSKKEWATFLKDYSYQTDEQAAAFAGSPIDKIKEIVKGGYPMLHVCGDQDEVVPISENTSLFAEKIKQAGGNISIIHKPEGKHHPHSLPNPQPIVDFILRAAQK
ncbi:GDSL-type esterase/lipase family protein [Pedobacter africanus]|uniref:Lysophospholipase L1 n=1 Tax=Pedobacter africanus TaxID=151894 RepID=A0A1W1YNJ1_9SPHI|nr:GDSL-type esterase/lipase family protein [Pedobacter africanus]SMC37729.1 Lysophospholipase L1 [Pedobacter africanus]